MRVAAIYDIHGNLPALEAVMDEVRLADVEHIIIGGDVVPGPMPAETLGYLSDLDIPVQFIRGNGDRVVLAQMRGGDISEVPEGFRDVIRWTAEQLSSPHERLLGEWPSTITVEVEGVGKILFCHATPRNDTDIFTRLTADERVAPAFADVDVPLVVCGHTHIQFDRTIGGIRVVNAGSVGMPFSQPAGAYWLLLGPAVDLRRTSYDVAKVAQQLRQKPLRQVEDLFVRYVLAPPTEAESLERFTPAEMARPSAVDLGRPRAHNRPGS